MAEITFADWSKTGGRTTAPTRAPVRDSASDMPRQSALRPLLLYGILALSIMLPMLRPGYIFALDMAFTPQLRMPSEVSSSYLFHAGLHYLNLLIPSQIIQKILLLSILLLSAWGAYRLTQYIQKAKDKPRAFDEWGALIAGALYMINPFTYSRFMSGQYAVLLGYALLPFFVRTMLQFLAVPTWKRLTAVCGWLIAISIVSIHTLGLAAIAAIISLGVYAWRYRNHRDIVKRIVVFGTSGLMLVVIASGYWLFPLITGTSTQGQAVHSFGTGDRAAFATSGDGTLGKLGNVLQLQGFWAEEQGLYLLPQEQLPGWGLVVLVMWTLVGVGAWQLWKRQRVIAVVIIGSGIAAIVVATIGVGLPGALAGFREPHKFIGLLALAYAVCAGLGTGWLLQRFAQKHSQMAWASIACLVLLMPALFTPTMFWGFDGQLSARSYPADWTQMNTRLHQDTADFKVLFLPWHQYMHFAFAGRVIVAPAEDFFDKPTLVSNELEFRGASPTFPHAGKAMITQLLKTAPTTPNLGQKLNEFDIKYVLLAKTFDYQTYRYLDNRHDFRLVAETANLKLYRNLAYE